MGRENEICGNVLTRPTAADLVGKKLEQLKELCRDTFSEADIKLSKMAVGSPPIFPPEKDPERILAPLFFDMMKIIEEATRLVLNTRDLIDRVDV